MCKPCGKENRTCAVCVCGTVLTHVSRQLSCELAYTPRACSLLYMHTFITPHCFLRATTTAKQLL